MIRFDLRKIHDLLPFENLFLSDSEYMREVNSLPHINLKIDPLYKLEIKGHVLFTTKLHYYARLVENEVDLHIKKATKLFEEKGENNLIKFVLKETRESVLSLVNDANKQICIHDKLGSNWNNIISENPNYDAFRSDKEFVVFYHYTIAQLVRCWLELQDRYVYIIGKELYDVDLFYSAFVRRTPDSVFEISKMPKSNDELKKKKIARKDCCFLYDNEEYFAIAIQEFTNKLHKFKLIPDDVDCKYMESLFIGHSCRRTYVWLGGKHLLTHIIKGLCDKDDPVITTWPEGTSPWYVVSCRFVDKEGKPLGNIKSETKRKTTKTIVDEVINSLAGHML